MGRIRSIYPGAYRSRDLCKVPREVRWTFTGLWTLADDEGRMEDDPVIIAADLYTRDPGVTPAVIEDELDLLAKAGLICRYEVGAVAFLHVIKFRQYQHPKRFVDSKLPPCGLKHDPQTALFPACGEHAGNAQAASGPRARVGEGEGEGVGVARAPVLGQRAKQVTDAYHAAEPMCNWPAVNQIVRKAMKLGRWTDEEIRAALLTLAEDKRPVTTNTLRMELDPPDDRPPRRAEFGSGDLGRRRND